MSRTEACEQDDPGCVPFCLVNTCLHCHSIWTPKTMANAITTYCKSFMETGTLVEELLLLDMLCVTWIRLCLCIGFPIRLNRTVLLKLFEILHREMLYECKVLLLLGHKEKGIIQDNFLLSSQLVSFLVALGRTF